MTRITLKLMTLSTQNLLQYISTGVKCVIGRVSSPPPLSSLSSARHKIRTAGFRGFSKSSSKTAHGPSNCHSEPSKSSQSHLERLEFRRFETDFEARESPKAATSTASMTPFPTSFGHAVWIGPSNHPGLPMCQVSTPSDRNCKSNFPQPATFAQTHSTLLLYCTVQYCTLLYQSCWCYGTTVL